MKHSNTWFALILIASALLLNGVSNGSGATQSNQPQTNQIEHTTKSQQVTTTPVATVSKQRSPTPAGSQSANYTYNYYYPAPESGLTFFGQIAGIISALLLTVFTCGLWWTSIKQWQAIDAQAKIADESLQQTARPRLKLRAFVGSFRIVEESEGRAPDMPQSRSRTDVNDRRKLNIEFELVNAGTETALIAGSNVSIHLAREVGLPMKPPYLTKNNDRIQHPPLNQINGGTFHAFDIELDEWLGAAETVAMREGRFYVPGYVVYLNSRKGANTYYRTAFCRKWNPDNLRFYPITDSDYEYED